MWAHIYYQNMSKRSSCITAVGSFNLLHAFILPKCLLSIFLSHHLSFRLFSCPRFSASCLKYLSVHEPPCLRASLQCNYIFTLFSMTIMPACLPFCLPVYLLQPVKPPIFVYLSALLTAYLSIWLPANPTVPACPFCRPTCVHNFLSLCLLTCPSSFQVFSLPVCLPVCKCVPPVSSCLYYVTCLSNRSNYTFCLFVWCTCLWHLQGLTFACAFVCIPYFRPWLCLSTCLLFRLHAKIYFPISESLESVLQKLGGIQYDKIVRQPRMPIRGCWVSGF